MRPWRGTVTVPDEGAVITASIPALAPAPAVVAAPSPAVVVAPVAPRADDHPGSGARIAGVAFMGIGGAAMITSVVLGVVAKSNYNEAGNNCGASSCNSSGKSTIDDARSLGNLATGVFIGGAVVAAAGVVVFIVAPSASRSSASASLRVGPGSAWLEGSF
jgi:hypothetical protein